MLNNLTTKFQEALMQAQQTAGRLGKPEISSLDVLVALLEQEGGILSPILRKASCDPGLLLQAAQREVSHEPTQSGATTQPQMGRDLATVMQAAEEERKKLKDDYLSVEHFMLGALDTQNKVHQLTDTFGLTKDNYLAAMKEVRGNQRVTDDNPEGKYQTLEKYGTDLTARARAGKIDPVIGRDTEIRRVLQILSRRTKNNPVLIGEPGVGKTAIAEGLARRIVNGDVPESMRNKRIVSLNIGSMLAGAKYRGEFEERLKSFLKEVTDSNGEIILFIDELHTIVGAGASEGAVDASNLLKPALARGELRTIGATTLDEYRKYIEKDAALERRFQPVMVSEPSVEDTIAILRGLKERYEVHHGVRITDAAIVAAATLSDRYISDRFLPDKAVDLVDEAAARLKIELDSMPTEIDQIEREAMQLEMERQALAKEEDADSKARLEKITKDLADLKEKSGSMIAKWKSEKEVLDAVRREQEKIEALKLESERAKRMGDLTRASEITYGELPEAQRALTEGKEKLSKMQKEDGGLLKEEVTEGDGHVSGVRLSDGQVIPAEVVVVSAGVRANTALAKEIGLDADRAVKVNERMETSVPNVYACGDCAEFNGANYAVWPEASEQGRIAGANAAGDQIEYAATAPTLTFHGMNTALFAAGDNGKNPNLLYKTAEFKDMGKGRYSKYYFLNNRLAGVIMIGDLSDMVKITEALEKHALYKDVLG